MGINHKVAFRSEQTIAAIAARCWAISCQLRPFTFDVVGFIKNVLVAEGIDTTVSTRGRKKGKLAIKFFDRQFPQDDPAYVEFANDQRETTLRCTSIAIFGNSPKLATVKPVRF